MLDVHPDCRGTSEALAWLEEQHGIPPERVVAVGDAANDLTMLSDAGFGVCMEESEPLAGSEQDRRQDRNIAGGANPRAPSSCPR